MNILVTGGNGYIGSETVKELKKQGHKPVVVDNLSVTNNPITYDIGLRTTFIKEDIRYADITGILENYDIKAVIHLAALASVPGSISCPQDYYDVNVLGTLKILKGMKDYGISRLVFATTGAINSDTPYGHSKLACEMMIKDMLPQGVILRYFNVAGGNDHSQEHVLPRIIKATIEQPFIVAGLNYDTRDGTCERDYVHVVDVAQANVLALTSPVGTYEVGTGIGTTVQELIRTCYEVTGKLIWFNYGNRRLGDETSLVADPSKWLPGWKPEFTLEDIIRSAI